MPASGWASARWWVSGRGKRFELELAGTDGEAALARMSELAGELLANPVIEEFTLRVL